MSIAARHSLVPPYFSWPFSITHLAECCISSTWTLLLKSWIYICLFNTSAQSLCMLLVQSGKLAHFPIIYVIWEVSRPCHFTDEEAKAGEIKWFAQDQQLVSGGARLQTSLDLRILLWSFYFCAEGKHRVSFPTLPLWEKRWSSLAAALGFVQ